MIMTVALIRLSSPDSISLLEFRGPIDIQIAEKMLKHPMLKGYLSFTREFDMTNDSNLFEERPGKGRLPLYEGKMIHQFDHRLSAPRYWVSERDGRKTLLGSTPDNGQLLDYQVFRLGFRDIARNTDTRTMISAVIPPAFHGNKIPTARIFDDGTRLIADSQQLVL